MTRAVEVRVGELVLEGVAPGDGRRVADAVQVELTRLVRGRDEWRPQAADDAVVEVQTVAGESADALGVRVARAVHGALQP